MGLSLFVRLLNTASHLCLHLLHFHRTFLFDANATSVGFVTGSSYSFSNLAPRALFSLHRAAKLLVGLNGSRLEHDGQPLGFFPVRLYILALHSYPHSRHFHSALNADLYVTAVAFLSGSTYSPLSLLPRSSSSPSFRCSSHHTAKLLPGPALPACGGEHARDARRSLTSVIPNPPASGGGGGWRARQGRGAAARHATVRAAE